MLKIIAWDGDGVAFNSLPTHYLGGICGVFRRLEISPVSFDCVRLTCHPPFESWWGKQGVDLPSEELWRIYHEELGEGVSELMPGVIDLFRECKQRGIILVLITASSGSARRILDKFPAIRELIDEPLFGVQEKTVALQDLSVKFNVPLTEIVMIGDMPSDILDAQRAGVRAIGFNHPYPECLAETLLAVEDSLQRAGAEIVCSSMLSLQEYLFSLSP